MPKKLIIANWKMNPRRAVEAVRLAKKIEESVHGIHTIEMVIAPPFPFIMPVARTLKKVKLGAQNMFWEKEGARTGEVSAGMLKNLCVSYCIMGHSERRTLGETDQQINKKIKAALKSRLIPVLAIGEKKQVPEPSMRRMLETQLKEDLSGISKIAFKNGVIAYEPVWAIGTGLSAAPEHARKALGIIRKTLGRLWKTEKVSTRIIYGGSVNAKNALPFVSSRRGGMDGILIGKTSLEPVEFIEIVKAAANAK